ncbi:MAG: cupin [Alphaproteobacteria bacterium]
MAGTAIETYPIHLGRGATAQPQPRYTGEMGWYEEYGERHDDDGAEGRLMAMHRFTKPWDMWEMHPRGSEVVLCIAGSIALLQEMADGKVNTVTLGPGEYAINEPGIWHTADIDGEATVLFVTAGLDTQHRPR